MQALPPLERGPALSFYKKRAIQLVLPYRLILVYLWQYSLTLSLKILRDMNEMLITLSVEGTDKTDDAYQRAVCLRCQLF